MANRNPSAQVLDVHGRLFLIDCGEGTQMQMCRMGISQLRIEAVFLTHLHGDHFFGLFGLLSTMEMLGRVKPLRIFAPAAFAGILEFYRSRFSDDAYPILFTPLSMTGPEVIFDGGTFETLAFPLRHGVPTFGFLFREKERELNVRKEAIAEYSLTVGEILRLKAGHDVIRPGAGHDSVNDRAPDSDDGHDGVNDGEADSDDGHDGVNDGEANSGGGQVIRVEDVTRRPAPPKSFAYCSDTAAFPELADWVRGVDLLYHEATFPQAMEDLAVASGHSTTRDAALCALRAGAGRLIVAHYSSRFADVSFFLDELRAVFPASFLLNDGDVFEI